MKVLTPLALVLLCVGCSDPESDPDAELIKAAATGKVEDVRLLLKGGASLNATHASTGLSVCQVAVTGGHSEVVQVLIKAGADVEERFPNKTTPLMNAVSLGHSNVVKVLIENGADVNATEPGIKATVLIKAASGGADTNILNMLIEAGADVNAKTSSGFTALDLCTDSRIQKILRDAGAR